MSKRTLPPNASVAVPGNGDKMVAPAATRNTEAIAGLLSRIAPQKGRALELASGTGQHVAAFSSCLPGLQWQPTEVDPARRTSIDAYANERPNVSPALPLDATAPGWGVRHGDQSLIVLINLLHLISLSETETLISETAQALLPGGRFVLYGPFMRSGKLVSDGDARFHATLTAQDPEIGYKDDLEVTALLGKAGLELVECIEMPANNLALISERPTS